MKNHDDPRSPLVDATVIMAAQDKWGQFDFEPAYIYSAIDNNGGLICLTTDQQYAIDTADDHFKDVAGLPILGDEFPKDTPVCNGQGEDIGTLEDLS